MIVPSIISTAITTIVGILISLFTAYLTHKIKQRDEEMIRYRKEREEKQTKQLERHKKENQARDLLTLGMARTMLLNNYENAVNKGYYSITERDVYHELYEAYKGAGGNGVMVEIAEKIVQLPTNPLKK